MSEEYDAGYRAYVDGLDYSDNPYSKGLRQWEDWAHGWVDADYDYYADYG